MSLGPLIGVGGSFIGAMIALIVWSARETAKSQVREVVVEKAVDHAQGAVGAAESGGNPLIIVAGVIIVLCVALFILSKFK